MQAFIVAIENAENDLREVSNNASAAAYADQARGMMDDLASEMTSAAFNSLSPHDKAVHLLQTQKKAAEKFKSLFESVVVDGNLDKTDKSI
jgi:hypothetical protein